METKGEYLTSKGDDETIVTNAHFARVVTTGDEALAVAVGRGSGTMTTGDFSSSVAAGPNGAAASTGWCSHAVTLAHGSVSATEGQSAIAVAVGIDGRARARSGAIMLAEYDDDCNLVAVAAAMVGQNGIEADVWYKLLNGVITRCDDQRAE